MLAGQVPDNLADIRYPVYVTPKLDGIRCVVVTGQALSRSLKPIPNDHVRGMIEDLGVLGLDGELVLRDATGHFGAVSGAVMRKSGKPDFQYVVFDQWTQPGGYLERVERLKMHDFPSWVVVLDPVDVWNEEELAHAAATHLEQGFEGTMLRIGHGPYKQGRSTTNEAYLLKMKPFEFEEAVVTGMEEMLHNDNVAKTNALGQTERSSHKAGMRAAGVMGKLIGRTRDGREVKVGSGFTAEQRREIWDQPGSTYGRVFRFKHQTHGAKDGFRIPIFDGWRERADLDADDLL